MKTVSSNDGTKIVYDEQGQGPASSWSMGHEHPLVRLQSGTCVSSSHLAPVVVMNVGPGDACRVLDGGEGGLVDAGVAAALLAEAQGHVKPFRIAVRALADGFTADLVDADGHVAVASYSSGSDELTAVLAAEQRYLVEQVGRGSVRGATYAEKACERIRRGPASTS